MLSNVNSLRMPEGVAYVVENRITLTFTTFTTETPEKKSSTWTEVISIETTKKSGTKLKSVSYCAPTVIVKFIHSLISATSWLVMRLF